MTLVDILPSELPDVARASYDTETGTVGTPDGALFPDDGCRVSDGSVGWHDPETGEPMSAAWRFWDAGGHGGALPRREWDHLQDWLSSRSGLVYMNATMDVESNRAGTGLGWPGADLIGNIAWDIGLVAGILDPGTLVALDAQAKLAYGVSDKATALEPLEKWLMAARREVAKPRHARNRKHRKDGTIEESSTPEEERFQTWAYYLAPWDLVRPYAATDAELTIRLARRQWNRLREGEGGPKRWQFIRNDHEVLRTLIRMERRGLPYDWEQSAEIAAQLAIRREIAYSALPMGDPTPTNLAEWFYGRHRVEVIKKTPGGKPSLDKEVMDAFAELDTPGAAELRTWRTLNGAIERWYGPFAEMTNKSDGRLRPRFKQTTVKSGRLSIQRVQLQAIPHNHVLGNTPELAGVPTPRALIPTHGDGWDRWEMDLAQAELRVAAWMAPAMKMLQIVREGRDPHGELATSAFDIKPGHPDWFLYRQVGKRGNFSLIFGIGRVRLRADIKTQTGRLLPWEEIDSLRETFNDMHPEFRRAIQSESRKILSNVEQPSVGLCNGRRNGVFPYELDRDFDEATGKPYGPAKGMHKAFNRKVQGSIGEFAKEWMVRADAYLMSQIDDPAHGLLLQNHDALLISVPAGEDGAVMAKQVRQIGLDLWIDWFRRPCDEEIDPSGFLTVPGDIDMALWNSK